MTALATETSTIVEINNVQLRLETKEYSNGRIVRRYTDGLYTLAVEDDDPYVMLARNDSFLPDLYLDYRGRKSVTIQTTSYGAMSPEQIDEIMAGFTRAKYAAAWISAVLS